MDEQDFVILDEDDLDDYNESGLLPLPDEKIKEIQQWLKPTNYLSDSSEYNKHLKSHLSGTGAWIRETDEYQKWHLSTEFGSLWIKAGPGAGKSVLAASLVSHLSGAEHVPVVNFFFRQIVTANQKPENLARDWLSQMLHYIPLLQSRLYGYIESHRNLDSVSFDELWHVLIEALSSLPKVYCVVDALDEMDIGNERFLHQLLQLGRHKPSSIKVIMTSRLIPRIERVLKHSTVVHLSLFEQAINDDINYYVQRRLRNSSISTATRLLIHKAIKQRAQGLFLYARLMLDDILESSKRKLISDENLHTVLDRLPRSLAGMYNAMLVDHSARSGTPQDIQLIILQWVTQSSRPLRLLEISAIIDFIKPCRTATRDTKALVRAGCGPLIEILEDETVSIIHHSFTEFLVDRKRGLIDVGHPQFPVIDHESTQTAMALVCLSYMTSGVLDKWQTSNRLGHANSNNIPDQHSIHRLRLPFFDYATEHWSYHAINASNNALFPALDGFMQVGTKAFSAWLDLRWPRAGSYPAWLEHVRPLHAAACMGLSHYCMHLIEDGHDLNVLDIVKRSPLTWATINGHAETVRSLVKEGAQLDLEDLDGLKPLHHAARANHFAALEVLLEAGVDPLTPKTKESRRGRVHGNPRYQSTVGDTALKYAAKFGHLDSMRLLMKYVESSELNRALCWAAQSGKTELVCALLERADIDVNSFQDGATSLYHAAAKADPIMIDALLKRGADVHICCYTQNESGRFVTRSCAPDSTVMHSLCGDDFKGPPRMAEEEALKKSFMLLRNAGCNVNAADRSGLTPLHHAVYKAHKSASLRVSPLVSLLLKHGAHASAKDNEGDTPLHRLGSSGPETVSLLCRHGAGVNEARRKDGYTPLHTVMRDNLASDILMAMLANNPNPESRDHEGDTIFHLALKFRGCNEEIVSALLRAGYDVNATNKKMETPMHCVANTTDQKGLRIIVDAGSDLNLKDIYGHTALFSRMEQFASHETVRDLINAGSDINACDSDGRTLLHSACRTPELKRIQLLVNAGVNPLTRDFAGNNILHEAAKISRIRDQDQSNPLLETIVNLLGSSALARNHRGQSPLHIAASIGQSYDSDFFDQLLHLTCPAEVSSTLTSTNRLLDVDARDNNLTTPIHVAAATCTLRTDKLLKLGADPKLVTIDGQSPLHLACRAGQSNTAGLLIEHYVNHGQSDFIDMVDNRGRTALFDACVSGRVESVRLLLDAGARGNHRDKESYTPLDACAEYQHELDRLWRDSVTPHRFAKYDSHSKPVKAWSSSGFDTASIRQVIRLLLLEDTTLGYSEQTIAQTPAGLVSAMRRAVDTRNEVMAEEISLLIESLPPKGYGEIAEASEDYSDGFRKLFLASKTTRVIESLKHCVDIGRTESNLKIFKDLLLLDDEGGIKELTRLGCDLIGLSQDGKSCLHILAAQGRTSLMHKIGGQAPLITETWINKQVVEFPNLRNRVRPILHVACERSLPNIDMILLLVERLKVDVNARAPQTVRCTRGLPPTSDPVHGPSALHVLASGHYWWQAQAIEVLVRHGADIEIKDQRNRTPLQIALASKSSWRGAVVERLLQLGADPNVLDSGGRSCLGWAASNVELVRKLIQCGADVNIGSQPPIYYAIEAMNTDTLRVLLSNNADCNIHRVLLTNRGTTAFNPVLETPDPHQSIALFDMLPIHFAASRYFSHIDRRSKAITMIELLLEYGATPFLTYPSGVSMVHDLFSNGGTFEPLLALNDVDLEVRDLNGKTLLLASCMLASAPHGPSSGYAFENGRHIVEVLHRKGAQMDATDYSGKTVFHHIVDSYNSATRSGVPVNMQILTYFLGEPAGPKLAVQKDKQGFTPLHYAFRGSHVSAIEDFLANGADPIEPDPDGNNALHHFSKSFFKNSDYKKLNDLFKKFISLGADINHCNNLGETPLSVFLATAEIWNLEKAYRRQLRVFIKNGADIFIRNAKGKTLLHIVAKRSAADAEDEITDTFVDLLRRGLDSTIEDNKQRSALDVASAFGHQGILKLFKRGSLVDLKAEPEDERDLEGPWPVVIGPSKKHLSELVVNLIHGHSR